MKHLDTIIHTLEGVPYQAQDGKDLTIKAAIILVCSVPIEEDKQLDYLKKAMVGEIALAAHKGLRLTSEQITTAKQRVAKVFDSPVLVHLLHEALDAPADKTLKPVK